MSGNDQSTGPTDTLADHLRASLEELSARGDSLGRKREMLVVEVENVTAEQTHVEEMIKRVRAALNALDPPEAKGTAEGAGVREHATQVALDRYQAARQAPHRW